MCACHMLIDVSSTEGVEPYKLRGTLKPYLHYGNGLQTDCWCRCLLMMRDKSAFLLEWGSSE